MSRDLHLFIAGVALGGAIVRVLIGHHWSALLLVISGILFLWVRSGMKE